ncbi:hypothetical protein [Winogradskyella flava]|uniref:Uncharacterized protein n=1 Tax=Winogradskyella flava TaxID=1884876 RepID=A0A842IUV5_9FLAO|nr:hypothetical protein [Winogradskyella flava]MBC2844618.1 hypothetical protein [Winogradskyella flava]
MFEKLITYLKFGNQYHGLEQVQINGTYCFYGISLKKKKKHLDVASSFKVEDIDDLKVHIPKDKPVSLVINTNAVLTKHVQGKANESLKLVQLAFPNIKIEDFYFETISNGGHHLVSLCRKSYVDDLLNIYAAKGITIIDFTLGNLVCATLASFVDLKEIQTSNASITIEDKSISKIISKEELVESSYNINGLVIKNNQLLSFASALGLVLKNQTIQASFSDVTNKLETTFNQKRFTNQFLKIGLGVLFAVLLFNFLFFNHYYNEVGTLKETAQVLETSKTNMISLKEKVYKTEKMVSDILKANSSKSSFYVNAIIEHLPNHILLNELNYQPLIKKIKADKVIEMQKDNILISGQTNKGILFSQWIYELEAKPWISSVNILGFEDINRETSNFTIKLNLHGAEN